MVKEEGYVAFTKGLGPKLLTTTIFSSWFGLAYEFILYTQISELSNASCSVMSTNNILTGPVRNNLVYQREYLSVYLSEG